MAKVTSLGKKDAINKIVVTTEDNRALEITVLLVFELPEFNKKYVLYYLENDNADENVTMFISEFNPITNEIKEINKDEIDILLNEINYFDSSPQDNNIYGIYDYIIFSTKKAISEVLKDILEDF